MCSHEVLQGTKEHRELTLKKQQKKTRSLPRYRMILQLSPHKKDSKQKPMAESLRVPRRKRGERVREGNTKI